MSGQPQVEFVFPRSLVKLAWQDRLAEGDFRARVLPDAATVVSRYARHFTSGIDYQRHVVSAANLQTLNRITREDLANSKKLMSQGWKYVDLADLLQGECPGLAAIPHAADLFSTREHDHPALEAVAYLRGFRGIGLANATKILHQKRPGIFPILDSVARATLGLPWIREEGPCAAKTMLLLGMDACREVRQINRLGLNALHRWVRSGGAGPLAATFTPLRLIDVLAWMANR
jgi:Family of unknown function (DUF6308)